MNYYAINKPYGMLSQFTREADHHQVLGDLFDFPSEVYSVGRLDRDSEGLLILTDDKKLHTKLLNPKWGHERTYWVQVEGVPDEEALAKLCKGVSIQAKKQRFTTLPARAKLLDESPPVRPRNPPIRVRKSIPDSWLELTITEGKNRQVRRMCAAVGFPVLRLIRSRIEGLLLEHLGSDAVLALEKADVYRLLKV